MDRSSAILSDLTIFSKYARYISSEYRRETWNENSDRLAEMHIKKFPHCATTIQKAFKYDKEKRVLASMRTHQFAGIPIERNNSRGYNCSYIAIENYRDFAEILFLSLGGTGVGYSVSYRHISKLPTIKKPKAGRKFLIGDTIEGWSDAVRALFKAFLYGGTLPLFDYSDIRPKGTPLKVTGGKAPGPEPLRKCLEQISKILSKKNIGERLSSLEIHDIICHLSDAVLSGGIRRSATIALFDVDDIDMLTCKSNFNCELVETVKDGLSFICKIRYNDELYDVYLSESEMATFQTEQKLAWYYFHPQRARANNSVRLYRNDWYGGDVYDQQYMDMANVNYHVEFDGHCATINRWPQQKLTLYYDPESKFWYTEFIPKTTKKEFASIWSMLKASGSGEPGIFWTNGNPDIGTNPCGEISLVSKQFCNLTEINLSIISTQKELEEAVWAATIIGTLQASYTDFHYLSTEWKQNSERESLLGISLTGISDCDYTKFDFEKAARYAIEVNREFSKELGISPAARLTCIKPAGTTSCVLGTSSGIHARHSKFYIRRLRFNKNESVAKYLIEYHPELVSDDIFNSNSIVVSIPQKSPNNSIIRTESALNTLERVKYFNQHWIRPGHVSGIGTHNVSSTISVKPNEFDDVREWMWKNKEYYTGISILPYDEHTYKQAPFEECTEETYNEMYDTLTEIDLQRIVEYGDDTNLKDQAACVGGLCELT